MITNLHIMCNTNIAEMWKCHYKSLLNSVENKNCKKSVMLDINKQIKNSITITPFMLCIKTDS